jgi:hypothetical protein
MTQENSSKPSSASVEYRCYHCKQVFPEGTDHFGKYEEMPKCIENPRRGVYGGIHDAYIRVRKDVFSQMESEAQLSSLPSLPTEPEKAAQPSVQRNSNDVPDCGCGCTICRDKTNMHCWACAHV